MYTRMAFIYKYRNFILLLLLVVLWSFHFSSYKLYMFDIFNKIPVLAWNEKKITLEYIAGYLSFWVGISYIIGIFLYKKFWNKIYHSFITFITIAVFFVIYGYGIVIFWNEWTQKVFGIWVNLFVAIATLVVGFCYGLWCILRNILVATEIQETKLWDTKVNGIVNILFTTFIIIGSIGGSYIAETFHIQGIYVLASLFFVALLLGIFVNLPHTHNMSHATVSIHSIYEECLYIIKKYGIVIVCMTLLLWVATLLSQKAIEYSMDFLWKKQTEASFLFLYTALWAIIGNIISMFIHKYKWRYFLVLCILFGLCSFIFPFLAVTFVYTILIIFIAWFFFWVTFNLIESYFLNQIAIENKKTSGATVYGFVSSIIVWFLMLSMDFLQKTIHSIIPIYMILWFLLIAIGITMFVFFLKHKD